jgi:hypothetical protein
MTDNEKCENCEREFLKGLVAGVLIGTVFYIGVLLGSMGII